MKNILLASDSFKGSLSSKDIVDACNEVIEDNNFDISLSSLLVADGGEGSIDALSYSLKGKRKEIVVKDANGFDIKSDYFLYDNKAIIEVSSTISLPKTKIKDPLLTSSFGVGQLIKDAINEHVKEIIICLGGSSTNDAGAGLIQALGAKFYDENDELIIDVSNHNLSKIKRIDLKEFKEMINDINFIALSDVDNPLLGPNGATYVYARQKGAKDGDLPILEENVAHFASLINKELIFTPKTGAAGGIGYILLSLFSATVKSGSKTILDMIGFDQYLSKCDVIITGEGRFDSQSLSGKITGEIINRSKTYNKDIYLLVGSIDGINTTTIDNLGIKDIKITNQNRKDFIDIKLHAKEDYKKAFKELMIEITK